MKEQIIQLLIDEQEHVIEDLTTAIEERRKAADIDEDDTLDSDDFAQQETNKDFIRKFREQLDIAKSDLATLKGYKFKQSSTFEPGALVETDDFYFVVGASVHNIEFNDKKVVSISTQAPVYHLNEGRGKTDKMKMGQQEVKIKDIS